MGVELTSRPARGGWIEMESLCAVSPVYPSRPARGGWIEMSSASHQHLHHWVPPRTGRVD